MSPTDLARYRSAVALDEPFRPASAPAEPGALPELARTALRLLTGTEDLGAYEPRALLRAVLTVREPAPLEAGVQEVLDAVLGGQRQARPVVRPAELPGGREDLVLWRGDLTTLAADAVVNAANSALLGCFRPSHLCVDNAVHAVAGPRLRADCHRIVTAQGHPEPEGTAKITRGYHLPARYVLHTVGPVAAGAPTLAHARTLAACYRACLDLAAQVEDIRTVGFSAIGTGVFGYPKPAAARIAVRAVTGWLAEHPGRLDRVVLTAFGEDDHEAHDRALAEWMDAA
ncbi:O-acetyl-ADP-ribose deacetylase (regulator of RNase III) [Crossiella equi]|uniref:O-acetyl-ADP-ribose deacetylase (Regulator of RNase III) n=1 Tax=Crossiella equi TaxID=130796 RepID=A0ABS5A6Q3_9PSEU|nr:macro domain-containing protein [Crossiella equi]MBP2471981.1 O-acetyl-ADP-ribose deacetylase (regulator of RNase III) [Crossiella equi]